MATPRRLDEGEGEGKIEGKGDIETDPTDDSGRLLLVLQLERAGHGFGQSTAARQTERPGAGRWVDWEMGQMRGGRRSCPFLFRMRLPGCDYLSVIGRL